MQEHSINTDKFSAVWIPSYGTNSGYFETTPNTDLDYDLHRYTSKGRIAGFEHHLDINLISTLKEKEETFRNYFKTIRQSENRSLFTCLFIFLVCVIIDRIEKEFYEIEDFMMFSWIARVIKGIVIALGFILPGISGGVLAAILGIYERMISFLAHPLGILKRMSYTLSQ